MKNDAPLVAEEKQLQSEEGNLLLFEAVMAMLFYHCSDIKLHKKLNL